MSGFLVEVPSGFGTANRKIVKVEEGWDGEIDGEAIATHAFVGHNSCCCLASRNAGDRDRLATVWVAIGFSTH
jgi:hypothetical protein